MSLNTFYKVVASLVLIGCNIDQGQSYFYHPSGVAHPQGQPQPLYEQNEPPNNVGYGYKPSWAEIHLQALAEETPQYQQPVEKYQQDISSQPHISPAHTYLIQTPQKYHITPPRYQWTVQPSIKYGIPSLANHPLIHREQPQQNVNVLLPLRLFGIQSFPPFLERLIQRVQTYYSIYNPPDTLTIPYLHNTPPTFTASGLLPPYENPLVPVDNNAPEGSDENISGGDNNESTTDPSETGDTNEGNVDDKFKGDNSTEESNADLTTTEGSVSSSSTTESSTESENDESTTDSNSKDDTTELTVAQGPSDGADEVNTKKDNDNGSETTTVSTESNDNENEGGSGEAEGIDVTISAEIIDNEGKDSLVEPSDTESRDKRDLLVADKLTKRFKRHKTVRYSLI